MRVLDILVKSGVANAAAAEAIRDASTKTGWSPAAIALRAGLIDGPQLQALLVAELKERKVDVDKEKPDAATLLVIAPQVCWQRRVIPTWLKEDRATGDALYLAATDPTDEVVLAALAPLRVRVIAYVADDAAIERALERCHPGRRPDAIPPQVLARVQAAQRGIMDARVDDATEQSFLTNSCDEELLQRAPAAPEPGAAKASGDDLEWLLQRQQEAGLGRSRSGPAVPVPTMPHPSAAAPPTATTTAMMRAAPDPITIPPAAPGRSTTSSFAPPPVTLSTPPPAGDVGRRPLALNLVLVGAAAQRAKVRGVLAGWFASMQEADDFRQALGVAMTEHVDVFVLLDPATDADGRALLPAFLQRAKRPRVIAEGDDAGLPVDARLGRSMNELEMGAKIVRALAHG